MKCPYPLTIKHELLGGYIEVPCGKCLICQRNLIADWAFRLRYEAEDSKSVYFVRLSYDNEHIPLNEGYQTLDKRDLQKFFKRLRKKIKFRYFAVGEYGGQTIRPHYHILFFLPIKIEWLSFRNLIYQNWYHQNIHVQTARNLVRLAHYTGKYCFKHDNRLNKEFQIPPFRTCSKKPILGVRYLNNFGSLHTSKPHLFRYLSAESTQNNPVRLPLAFQRKLFKDEHDIVKLNRLIINQKESKNYEIENYFRLGETRIQRNNPSIGAYLQQRRRDYERIESERERIRKNLTDGDL